MFFQIENTPEHIRRARRKQIVKNDSPKEECPRLNVAPFSRPPQVLFENVLIGTSCERELEVFNPSNQVQQITLGKALPPGLEIHLPEEWLVVEPQTCYCLIMSWTPMQPTALRETIRFTDENRGRYDVIVVLKSAMDVKGKGGKSKGFKMSPGNRKRKALKRSPVAIYKKKAETIYNSKHIKKAISAVQSADYKNFESSNKENVSTFNDFSIDFSHQDNPFDTSSRLASFDYSEVFLNKKKTVHENILENTYETSNKHDILNKPESPNILRLSNKQRCDKSASDLFDNLTFTPLKNLNTKCERLEKGPKIVLSMNSDSDLDDSLDAKSSKNENETHSIICVTSSNPPNPWLSVKNVRPPQVDGRLESLPVPNKKIPNTSSPKELSSPNFSINTEFSRISDLSFAPSRFSTERKVLPRANNETREIFDDPNAKLNSDTYTKESPINSVDYVYQMYAEARPPHIFVKENPKMCRQALFREYQQQRETYDKSYYSYLYELNDWQHGLRSDIKSPPRSLTPPLQSIPEESTQFSDTQVLDKTNKQTTTFTINRTFDKVSEKSSLSAASRQSWSKKAVRAESELWKIPTTAMPRKSSKPKPSINSKDSLCGNSISSAIDSSKSVNQNVSLNQVGNVYSQSLTVDPFLSASYFYDEEAVDKVEKGFKRWLNCILTPPADLDSNVEQKIDVGKAWIENRNKEVPAAPTREQVCIAYHNSHRLESLRRAARALLNSPETSQVFQKLNAQIEKKLLVIRTDKNLHLDVGLQKIIMELILSYNPLWLRIGLEALYSLVLPLKSNSDIEGLTTFIIQRMFKNPYLKNKHSKSSAPNMLLPAYMEALKKFTLKKFFMLVFFLDLAKQRKLIPHDPCLFCRNAICKESREIVIRFTRELIAGIGDITKHLRPLGYVVSHKQSFLDEYKYAVHNIALDIRDGVRLTKVMEIILMKNGLLNQLRTPPISRLQKIHNVQVAMNALKEANFVIDGDIAANDIADGHREKTLSLLWQLIHVFRAPLFEKAANVIQTWWRKKYEVVVEKRKAEETNRQKLNKAASVIQCWWRLIQYNRLVEWQTQQITTATITIQKYCRMWFCRTRLRKLKTSILIIEQWYRSAKKVREAKEALEKLKSEREELRRKSATLIQSHVRRWLCMKQYKAKMQRIVLVQSIIRRFLFRTYYNKLIKSVTFIQKSLRGKLMMKEEMRKLAETKRSAIVIQSFYRMVKQRRFFQKLKESVKTIEERYIALVEMRRQREKYATLQRSVVRMQARYRGNKCRTYYERQRNLIVKLQRKFRAHLLMKKEKTQFIQLKNATVLLQSRGRSYLAMKKARQMYLSQRKSAILIQRHFKSYLLTRAQRDYYIQLRNAACCLQKRYRSILAMRQERSYFLTLKNAAILIQRQYRAQVLMKRYQQSYKSLRAATIAVQHRYRALKKMRVEKSKYLKLKSSCVTIQNAYRAYVLGKQQKKLFLKQREAAAVIRHWFRNCQKTKEVKQQYQQSKQACVTIQRVYRAYVIGRILREEYIRIRTATVCIQKYYRTYIEMKTVREQYIKLKTAIVTVQRFYKSYLTTKKQRSSYLKVKTAAQLIQIYYRRYRETKMIRHNYCMLRKTTISIQRTYRSIIAMRNERKQFLTLKQSVVTLQQKYRAVLAMRAQKQAFITLRSASVTIQTRFRAQKLMKKERTKYLKTLKACVAIQTYYRAYVTGKEQREEYLRLKHSAIIIQDRYRALIAMRRERSWYLTIRAATITIQRKFRARALMLEVRYRYQETLRASVILQRTFRAYLAGKKQRMEYFKIKSAATKILTWYRNVIESRKIRRQYLLLRNAVVHTQRRFRANMVAREIRRHEAVNEIQIWYISIQKRNECRKEYLKLKKAAITLQSAFRKYTARNTFVAMKNAALRIQIYYRCYKLAKSDRQKYVQLRTSAMILQSHFRSSIERKRFLSIRSAVLSIQTAYRLHRKRILLKKRREASAVCIQKNFRRYLAQSRYRNYRKHAMFLQMIWRGKLLTRLIRCEFLQKRRLVVKLQAIMRGYLIRKQVQYKKEDMIKEREEAKQHWGALKIQALFLGHKARMAASHDGRVAALRRRWREGALRSTQETLKERNEEAMEVLRNFSDIETLIRAFRSLELLTEVFPMTYNDDASSIVGRVFIYMSMSNRSISSVEMLKYAASVLVNLTRHRVTGPRIYVRERIRLILKFMLRFSNNEYNLFCILSTHLWLFAKYDSVKEDLTEFLHIPENLKMMATIKNNIERMKRMASKLRTQTTSKCVSRTGNQSFRDTSCVSGKNCSYNLPALEPTYGIIRVDKPLHFENSYHAISALFHTYKL